MQNIQYVWVIYRKEWKKRLFIDVKDIEKTMNALNKNDFIFLKNYQCTLHKFDVDEIKVEKMSTTIEKELLIEAKRLIQPTTNTPSLQFDQYFQWLQHTQKNQPKLKSMN